jgi:acyl-homoserine lactone synthase
MLCHCVTPANRQLYSRQLDVMFRMRHDVFVDGLGWRELRRADRRDIDEYDTDDSVYLLVINDDDDVVASGRLNPPWARNQYEEGGPLRTRFVMSTPPTGPRIWEGSRLLGGLPDRYGKAFARATQGILLAGGQEFCVRRGITEVVSIFETQAMSRLMSLGWQLRPLGLPTRYETTHGEGEAIAASWATSPRYLALTREAFGISGPVLFEAEPVLAGAKAPAEGAFAEKQAVLAGLNERQKRKGAVDAA